MDAEYAKDEHFQKISASVGAAYAQAGQETFDRLVHKADELMYQEKERNR